MTFISCHCIHRLDNEVMYTLIIHWSVVLFACQMRAHHIDWRTRYTECLVVFVPVNSIFFFQSLFLLHNFYKRIRYKNRTNIILLIKKYVSLFKLNNSRFCFRIVYSCHKTADLLVTFILTVKSSIYVHYLHRVVNISNN